MEELEEGEISEDVKQLASKKVHKHNHSHQVKKDLPIIPLNIPSRTLLKTPPRKLHVCKSHQKKVFDRDRNKVEEKESVRTVKLKPKPLVVPDKSSCEFERNRSDQNFISKETFPRASNVSQHRNNSVKENCDRNFAHHSYPERSVKPLNTKTDFKINIDSSYEDLLDQYRTIQSQLKNLAHENEHDRRTVKSIDTRTHSKLKRKLPFQFHSSKEKRLTPVRDSKSYASSSTPAQVKKNRTSKLKPSVLGTKHTNLFYGSKTITNSVRTVRNKNANALEKYSKKSVATEIKTVTVVRKEPNKCFEPMATEDNDEDDLELLRRNALATCAKLPPTLPIANAQVNVNETNIETAALVITPDLTKLSFTTTDNYEVVDMDVSSDEEMDKQVSLNMDNISSITNDNIVDEASNPNENFTANAAALDDDDDSNDEEILRAQLILALNRPNINKNVDSTDVDHNKKEEYQVQTYVNGNNLITLTNAKDVDADKSIYPKVTSEHLEENALVKDILIMPSRSGNLLTTNASETELPRSELGNLLLGRIPAEHHLPNGVGCINQFSNSAPENLLSEGLSLNTFPDVSENVIAEPLVTTFSNILSGTQYSNDASKTITSLPEVMGVNSFPDELSVVGIAENLFDEKNGISCQSEDMPVQQTLSVTCRSDVNLSRKVLLTKHKPLSFPPMEPVQPVVIKFGIDSSDSDSDCDSDPENIVFSSLEKLIENAKNKSTEPPPFIPQPFIPLTQESKLVSCLPISQQVEYNKLKELIAQRESSKPESRIMQQQAIDAFKLLHKKLTLAHTTCQKENQLFNMLKIQANKRKSAFIASQSEVQRLREQVIAAEKVKNTNQKLMFSANAKLAAIQKAINKRKELIKDLQIECKKKGTQIFGPNYVMPKIEISSPFKFRSRPS